MPSGLDRVNAEGREDSGGAFSSFLSLVSSGVLPVSFRSFF